MASRLGRHRLERGEPIALAALLAIVLITVAWWGLALWPLSGSAPEWVLNVRNVCFGTRSDGLPDASGWLLLSGQPIGMLGFLLVVWGERVTGGLRALSRVRRGRALLSVGGLALLAGAGAASGRVLTARAQTRVPVFDLGEEASVVHGDDPAPPLELVNQHGQRVSISGFEGRHVILTFAFGHCETVCPVVVRQVLSEQARATDLAPVVLVVTLDPWRDTPSRLPHIADSWGLGTDAHVLSGSVAEVEAVLDGWKVPRSRDLRTGDVVHPALTYVISPAGRVVHAVNGPADAVADLFAEF